MLHKKIHFKSIAKITTIFTIKISQFKLCVKFLDKHCLRIRKICIKDTVRKDFNILTNNPRIVKWDYAKLRVCIAKKQSAD